MYIKRRQWHGVHLLNIWALQDGSSAVLAKPPVREDNSGHLRFIGKSIVILNNTLYSFDKNGNSFKGQAYFPTLIRYRPFRQASCLQNFKPSKALDGNDIAFF